MRLLKSFWQRCTKQHEASTIEELAPPWFKGPSTNIVQGFGLSYFSEGEGLFGYLVHKLT